MLKALCRGVLALLMGSVLAAAQAAPILVVDANGILTGARNVDVNGNLYDVDFVDGTCVGLFAGCDASTDFQFTTEQSAVQAAQALLAAVLLNGPQGPFDSDPSRTAGCANPSSCFVATPYFTTGNAFSLAATINDAIDALDLAGPYPLMVPVAADTTLDDSGTFARWSRVPEPHTLACLAIGGFALVLLRQRRSDTRTFKRLS